MDLYGLLFNHVLLPGWERRVRRRPTLDLLRYLERAQWRPTDEILAAQAGELRQLLAHAYKNVPFYRAAMHGAGVRPEEIRGPQDLSRLPILTRELARETTQARTSEGGPPLQIRKSTSGTLGRPLLFGYDCASEHWRQATKLRGYAWAGYRLGDGVLHYWAPPMQPPAAAKQAKILAERWLKREQFVDLTRRSEEQLEAMVRRIVRNPPRAIVCYAQAGGDLARYINDQRLRSWDDIPVLCGAERLLPPDRAALERAFGSAIFETYGCREVMLIASECERHDGLHLSSENLVVELLVEVGGTHRAAQPGEVGEVVITDLHNYAMPFIRYANGDLAVAAAAERCACGRSLPKIRSIDGRLAETLLDGDGARISGLAFNVMMVTLAAAVRQFQVVQHKDRRVTLRLVPTPAFDDAARAAITQHCAQILKGIDVRTELVSEIPILPTGKRQVVVVER